jgi:hypothetical protein
LCRKERPLHCEGLLNVPGLATSGICLLKELTLKNQISMKGSFGAEAALDGLPKRAKTPPEVSGDKRVVSIWLPGKEIRVALLRPSRNTVSLCFGVSCKWQGHDLCWLRTRVAVRCL